MEASQGRRFPSRQGRPVTEADVAEQIKLLACLIAEGCNIGLAGMETNSSGPLQGQLAEVKFSYIREETLARATVRLVNTAFSIRDHSRNCDFVSQRQLL